MNRAGVLVVIAAAVVIGAPAAQAQTAYRYWTYWQVQDTAWRFASIGPASALPADGAVEGWRFAVTTEQADARDAPRVGAVTAFADICGTTDPSAGSKRVALVLDFGDPADAPDGQAPPAPVTECVVVAPDASGYQVLSAVAAVRAEDGLVCGIDGFPGSGCADVVDAAAPTAVPNTTDAAPTDATATDAAATTAATPAAAPALGGGWAMLVGALALLGAAIAGAVVWRRRTP